jgi:hypothetical protein
MSDTTTNIPKIRSNEIVRQSAETVTRAISRDESTFASVSGIAFETAGATALAPVIEIDRLYEAVPGSTSRIVRALELLKQAIDLLSEAKQSENPMDADLFVQRVQLALPNLFVYRSIGDGFGVIINSLYFALTNLHGTPVTSDQLTVMWRLLRELRARPIMSLEQGIQRVEELEKCGLEVDPPDLGDLLESHESAENE